MRVFIFLLMMFFNFSVLAGPLPAKLDLFLKSTQNISFEFLQTKTITEAGISLKSSGYGKFEKNNGFLWKTLQPKSSVFIATTSNYCLNDEKKAVSELPYYEQIKQIVDNFFSSDMDALEEYFEIQIISSNDWMMTLFPLVNKISHFIEKIEITGNEKTLIKLVIFYTNKDVLTIEFFPLKDDVKDEIQC